MSNTELVVGTSNGKVHVLNLIHGSQHDLAVDKSRISALHISESRLVVATVEGQLFEFARIGKEGAWAPSARLIKDELGQITALGVHEQVIYIAANEGTRVKAIDSQSGAVVAKWPKCSAPPVISLAKLAGGNEENLVIAFSDRQLHFSRSTKDTCALMGKSKPLQIEVNKYRGQKATVVLLSVEENGTVALYSIPRKSNDSQLRPTSLIRVSDDSLKIFAASFSDQNTLHIAYGNRSRPSFDSIKFVDANGNFETKIDVKPISQSLLPEQNNANKVETEKKNGEPNGSSGKFAIVNPFDLKVPTLQQQTLQDTNGSDEAAVPFGERIKAQIPTNPSKSTQPKVESIDAVLIQALKTKDQELLNKVFQTSNPTLIRRTIEKLPQSSVLPLLLVTVERFQTNPSMASQLTNWINSVLTIHLAYLMSVPSLPKAIGPLYSVIESRLAVFQDLLKLQGRLDLVVSQIERRKSSTAILSAEPNAVYREEDESLELDEDDDDLLGESDDMEVDEEEEDEDNDEGSASGLNEEDEEMEDASNDVEEND